MSHLLRLIKLSGGTDPEKNQRERGKVIRHDLTQKKVATALSPSFPTLFGSHGMIDSLVSKLYDYSLTLSG